VELPPVANATQVVKPVTRPGTVIVLVATQENILLLKVAQGHVTLHVLSVQIVCTLVTVVPVT
jgi:hypothetical protein